MTRYSFASAQAALPSSVVEELQADIAGSRSPLDMPFSGDAFEEIRAAAEQDLRLLLGLTREHHVLFLQGGATTQFALAPMNLLRRDETADYVAAGLWSRRAFEAASAWADVRLAAAGDGRALPAPAEWKLSDKAAYCHLASTETAEGLQFHSFPDLGGKPLVADMTADFLTRPLPLERFGLIYASAQKNLGIAGLTVIVIHEQLLERSSLAAPGPLNYALQAKTRSKVNTPPTFAIAVAAKMLRWLRQGGGLGAAGERAASKAHSLYSVIDEDDFYLSPANPSDRSAISIRFAMAEPTLEETFLREAEASGLLHLRGHAAVGGLRASLYNAVPQEAADGLAGFMRDFRRRRG